MAPSTLTRVILLCVAGSAVPLPSSAQQPLADAQPTGQTAIVDGVDYRVYDRQGRLSSMHAIVGAAMGDDVLLVGEEHDDMVGHAFEAALFEVVLEDVGNPSGSGRPIVLSLEMFERDVQYIVDEYLGGLITEDHFLRSARPWDDYEARYRPLVESARQNGAAVVAANAPRRYVNRVTNEGPESLADLSAVARSYLPPLPYPGPSTTYRAQWEAIMTAAMLGAGDEEEEREHEEGELEEEEREHEEGDLEEEAESDGPRGYEMSPNAIYSQALWDASMGHAISEALVRRLGSFVVHFAGSFHVEKDTGIVERIADYRPGTRVTTVVMTKVDDVDAWTAEEHATLADFVVLTLKPSPEDPGT